MFDTVQGLPVHALVVHGVVVLVPLAALGLIAIAVRPSWRKTYAPLVAILATVGLALVPVATKSGAEARGPDQRRRCRGRADQGPRGHGPAGDLADAGHVGARRRAARHDPTGPHRPADDRGRRARRRSPQLAAAGRSRSPATSGRRPSGSAPSAADRLSRPRARPGCAAAGAATPAAPGRCARRRPRRPGRTRARRGCTTAGSRRCRRPGRGRHG